jgi:hypothetical protein
MTVDEQVQKPSFLCLRIKSGGIIYTWELFKNQIEASLSLKSHYFASFPSLGYFSNLTIFSCRFFIDKSFEFQSLTQSVLPEDPKGVYSLKRQKSGFESKAIWLEHTCS